LSVDKFYNAKFFLNSLLNNDFKGK
jgi:hypothetical protein